MLDKMNRAILAQLKQNSRMSWQDIGKAVHLTGQAVAARVQQLEAQDMISGYTIRQHQIARHFITVFMEKSDFSGFEHFLQKHAAVNTAYKVTGEGCYQIEFTPQNENELEPFLNEVLQWGQYKVLSCMRTVK